MQPNLFKRLIRRWLYLLLGIAIAIGLSSSFSKAVAQPASYSPDEFLPPLSADIASTIGQCVPELLQVSERHVLQSATDEQGNAFYTIRVNLSTSLEQSLSSSEGGLISPERRSWGVLVMLEPTGRCQVLIPRGGSQPASWLELLPESVADQFAFQDLQFQQKLFQALNQDPQQVLSDRIDALAQSNGSLYADQAWAFQQLGFTLPASITIVDPRPQQPGGTP